MNPERLSPPKRGRPPKQLQPAKPLQLPSKKPNKQQLQLPNQQQSNRQQQPQRDEAIEEEEQRFYQDRASSDWLEALKSLGTTADKPFLETAPVLIGVFQQKFSLDQEGNKHKHYYPAESTGIACGLLLSALHRSGLTTLTHTPSPMKFMNDIFQRPASEKAFLLLVVGYPSDNCRVPAIQRKELHQFTSTVGANTTPLTMETT